MYMDLNCTFKNAFGHLSPTWNGELKSNAFPPRVKVTVSVNISSLSAHRELCATVEFYTDEFTLLCLNL